METIRNRLYLSIGNDIFCVLLLISLVSNGAVSGWFTRIQMLLVTAAVLALTFLSVLEHRKLKDALLILENQIINIKPVVVDMEGRGNDSAALSGESLEVFVSCFGILYDTRIVKFNQNGVPLKAVELGTDWILLTYGTEKKTKSIKIFHSAIDDDALAEMASKFRYETGIEPIWRNKKQKERSLLP